MKVFVKANGAALAVAILLLSTPVLAKEAALEYPVAKWDRTQPVTTPSAAHVDVNNPSDSAMGNSYPTTKVDRGQVQQWAPPATSKAPHSLPINTGQYPAGKNGKR